MYISRMSVILPCIYRLEPVDNSRPFRTSQNDKILWQPLMYQKDCLRLDSARFDPQFSQPYCTHDSSNMIEPTYFASFCNWVTTQEEKEEVITIFDNFTFFNRYLRAYGMQA